MTFPNQVESKIARRDCLKGALGAAATLFLGSHIRGIETAATEAAQTGLRMAPLTLKRSLELAGQNLLNILNPEDDFLPYWEMSVSADYRAALKRFWPAHNIGRVLDAFYRLNECIGFEIPEYVASALAKNTRRFFENPDFICLNPDRWPLHGMTTETGLQWDLHSLREGMLALNTLAKYQQSDWAADMGRKMVRSLDAKLKPDGSWDLEAFVACQKRGTQVIHNVNPSDTHGRLLEALIWFFETTGDPAVLAFADRLATWHFANSTQPDGQRNPAGRIDHTHSYFGTLRGLLLWGRLTHQREYIERVAQAYRVTVRTFVRESGYTSHNMAVESFPETTSPGDAAQLALWLTQDGFSEFLDDTDRLVRARILPSQILETPPLKPIPDFGKDASTDLEKRIIGAYGGCQSHPHGGKLAVTDVTSADVHTLVDIYNHVVVPGETGIEVFLHYDIDSPLAKITCKREKRGEIAITPTKDGPVAIRVPQWTSRETLKVSINGKPVEPVITGHFARLGKIAAGGTVTMQYDLPERQTQEKDIGVDYQLFWRGDDVIGVRPNTNFYPMYPDAPKGA